ncbi:chromate efflux transporter [Celeribacter indicus]|uniref:Chromate transporter n=1 Tax=Celeribacter indicus TaxID=1208324 RepID=A0A0B5E2H0_9RHOB|nr:chromate efflux transporter [Celeribacter indicus]AJE47216.1 chromate transporter [Celeribacter indicus]SDW00797.1 chromate transporter [Celeribacter indicus]
MTPRPISPSIPLPEFVRAFARIGRLSPPVLAAQIAVMHHELVTRRGWMKEEGFLSALSFCMMLPGPEAMQLATYCGWRLRGVPGGVAAGLFFVAPGALVMLALAALYARFGQLPLSEALFSGVKAAVVVIVLQALLRLARTSLGRRDRRALAIAAFLLLTVFAVPFPLIVAGAAAFGALRAAPAPRRPVPPPATGHLPRTLLLWGTLWALPLAGLWLAGQERLLAIGLFFSRLAVVTFGGAYAVLAYMSQEIVARQGWLTPEAMLDGLGLAETTPGPLILVTEFAGYLAAAPLGPWGGLAGAALTLWVTFVPCFLWIFAGAPYVDWIATRPRLSAALSAVTAAVVGVIAALAWWFALHLLFAETGPLALGPVHMTLPHPESLRPEALLLLAVAAVSLFALRLGLGATLGLAALAGLALHLPG